MRRIATMAMAIALAAGTAGVVGTGSADAQQAHARKARCVTHHEYKRIRKGMRRSRVERIFGDHKSWGYGGGAGGYVRSYMTCDHHHAAIIEYQVIWKKHKVVGARFDGHKRWIPAG